MSEKAVLVDGGRYVSTNTVRAEGGILRWATGKQMGSELMQDALRWWMEWDNGKPSTADVDYWEENLKRIDGELRDGQRYFRVRNAGTPSEIVDSGTLRFTANRRNFVRTWWMFWDNAAPSHSPADYWLTILVPEPPEEKYKAELETTRQALNQLRYDLGTVLGVSHWGTEEAGGPDRYQNQEIVLEVKQRLADGTSRIADIQKFKELVAKRAADRGDFILAKDRESEGIR